MKRQSNASERHIFVIVQDYSPFRFSWKQFYNPEIYDLVLVTKEKHYTSLVQNGDICFFREVRRQHDFGVEALKETVLELKDVLRADNDKMCLLCNDEDSIASTCRVADLLKMRSLGGDFVEKFTDKLIMKKALVDQGFRVPRHVKWNPDAYVHNPRMALDGMEQAVGYPCFAKPSDGSGSVNTKKILTRKELGEWCVAHLEETNYEIDEFIDGTLYHCDSIINEGDVVFTQVSRYLCTGHEFLLGKVDASITLNALEPTSKILCNYARDVLMALGAGEKGLVTHMEVFMTADASPIFLEVAARAPGGRVVPTYLRHLGCNFEEINFRIQMGLFTELNIIRGPYAAWASFPSRKGTVSELHKPNITSAHTVSWRTAPGEALEEPRDVADYVVAVEAWNDDLQALERDMVRLSRWSPCSYVLHG